MWKRPIFSILWSRLSLLLITFSYHLKDLPNKSIMLNEHGEKWQSRNWAFKITLQMHLINTLVKESLAFHTHWVVRRALPRAMTMGVIRELPLFPAGFDRSQSSWWIPLIFLIIPHWAAILIHEKKSIFHQYCTPQLFTALLDEIRMEHLTPQQLIISVVVRYPSPSLSTDLSAHLWPAKHGCLPGSLAHFRIILQSEIHTICHTFSIAETLQYILASSETCQPVQVLIFLL